MKLGRYIFGIALLVILIPFALANDIWVKLIIIPKGMMTDIDKVVSLPLYILVYLALFVGVLVGITIENFRNTKLRSTIKENNKRLNEVEAELRRSKEKFLSEEEKILDLLDK